MNADSPIESFGERRERERENREYTRAFNKRSRAQELKRKLSIGRKWVNTRTHNINNKRERAF
jgi:hypothetical protein